MLSAMMSDRGQKLISSQGGMFFDRDPLCSSFSSMQAHIAEFTLPEVAEKKAPLSEDFAGWDGSVEALYDSVNRQAETLRNNQFVEPEELSEKWWFPLVKNGDTIIEGNEHNYDAHYNRQDRMKKENQ